MAMDYFLLRVCFPSRSVFCGWILSPGPRVVSVSCACEDPGMHVPPSYPPDPLDSLSFQCPPLHSIAFPHCVCQGQMDEKG